MKAIVTTFFLAILNLSGLEGFAQNSDVTYFHFDGRYEDWLVQMEPSQALIYQLSLPYGGRGYRLWSIDTLSLNQDGSFGPQTKRLFCDGNGYYIDRPGLRQDAHRKLKPIPDRKSADWIINNARLNATEAGYHDSIGREYKYRRYYTPGYWKYYRNWDTMSNKSMPHNEFRLLLNLRMAQVLDSVRTLHDSFGKVVDRTIDALPLIHFTEFLQALSLVPPDDWQTQYYRAMIRRAILLRPELILQLASENAAAQKRIYELLEYNPEGRKSLLLAPGFDSVKRKLGLIQ